MGERLSNVVRRKFVDYFTTRHGHKFIKSSPVLPHGDRSLCFVNAGMNQFKPLFLQENANFELPRICNYQKCIRVGGKLCDIEQIGLDFRHHTFFEMLGNWSFNDYGKAEACEWAIDFLVNHLNIDSSRLCMTYFSGDNMEDTETKDIWHRLGFPSDRVMPAGSDNFWEMGSSGPCGMSTEILYRTEYDREPLEIWNLVFIDSLRSEGTGEIVKLKNRFVDTGMGLERILSVLENVQSNYDTDLFKTMFDVILSKSNVRPYSGSLEDPLDIQYRILVDHCRMIAVAIADGIKPGRRGNAHELRSIIKKALLISRDTFMQDQPRLLLFDLVDETVDILAEAYPELPDSIKTIRRTLAYESKHYFNYLTYQNTLPEKITTVKQVSQFTAGDDLHTIGGRVANFRSYKSFHFVDLVDGLSDKHIQLVVDRNIIEKPTIGSYLICTGNLVHSKGSKQSVEFKVKELSYKGECDPSSYPLASRIDLDQNLYRRYIHLRPRAEHFAALLRMRSELEFSLHLIMRQMDFIRVHTPTMTGNDSEASSDLFIVKRTKIVKSELVDNDEPEGCDEGYSTSEEDRKLSDHRTVKDDYFKKDVFMISSSQLHLESLAAGLSRVYTLAPAFRAENSLTTRHLCEFHMFEVEEANVTTLAHLMDRTETIIKFCAQYVAQVSQHKTDVASLLEFHQGSEVYEKLAHSEYIRIPYKNAIKILNSRGMTINNGCDIGRLHEIELLKYSDNAPIFITNYPKRIKPFYMKSTGTEAINFDLIAPLGGEICGGSLREDNEDALLENFKAQHEGNGLLENVDWYLDTRRYGSFPHGGFGIGFERLLQSLFGIKNIKDTTAFPRWSGKCPM